MVFRVCDPQNHKSLAIGNRNFEVTSFSPHEFAVKSQCCRAFAVANDLSRTCFCRNPRGIFPNKVPGEFCGGFFCGFVLAFFLGKNRRKKSTQKSTAKFKSEFGSFAAKIPCCKDLALTDLRFRSRCDSGH